MCFPLSFLVMGFLPWHSGLRAWSWKPEEPAAVPLCLLPWARELPRGPGFLSIEQAGVIVRVTGYWPKRARRCGLPVPVPRPLLQRSPRGWVGGGVMGAGGAQILQLTVTCPLPLATHTRGCQDRAVPQGSHRDPRPPGAHEAACLPLCPPPRVRPLAFARPATQLREPG